MGAEEEEVDDEELAKYDDSAVIYLTDSNFEEKVYGSKDIWMLNFGASWCGHCTKLAPHWNKVSHEMKGRVKFAKIEDTNKELVEAFGIEGYPTIKYFEFGEKSSPA